MLLTCLPPLPPTSPHCLSVDVAAQDGKTPLYSAAEIGHLEVVKALLAAGANKEAALPVSGVRACVYPPP